MLRASTILALGVAAGLATLATGANAATQSIRIDGSSTVYLITEAVAEEYRGVKPDVQITVGISGTGGGFKKFTAGELDAAGASRPIKPKEIDGALQGGVQFVELPVAYDGLSVVINPQNTWATSMTVAELKAMWEPGSKVRTWADVRAGWPDRPIRLYGAGTDSGTFDYFTEAIVGSSRASRSDYTASEDDNMLVQGVAGDKDAIGYFGFAYYEENKDRLKIVAIDGGKGPITPSVTTIGDGSYAPLSRPIFLYVRKTSQPHVREFVEFYLDHAAELSADVGYVALPPRIYAAAKRRFANGVYGSAMAKAAPGASLETIFGAAAPGAM